MSVSQSAFRAALLNPDLDAPSGLSTPHGTPATRRFAVYRNNVTVALIEALAQSFPVVAKLLGPTNFRNIARVFARAHPPKSPLMMYYGDDFPEFLAGFEPLAHLGYLPDVARLETALRHSYHAADAAPVAADTLAALPPDILSGCRMTLAPSLRLIRSDWPVHGIWQYNQTEGASSPVQRAETVLITRPEFDPQMHLIAAGSAAFIDGLRRDQTFADAAGAALDADADFDLTATLGLLLTANAITQIRSAS